MTRSELYRIFLEKEVPNAEMESMWLFSFLSGMSPAKLYAFQDIEVPNEKISPFIEKRLAHFPLAYLLHSVDFFEENYYVNEHVLIPRMDTEVLVEEAIKRIPKNTKFADLCTGSGCVAISTLCHRPDLSCDAYDISKEALLVAKENAERNSVSSRISLYQQDLLQDSKLNGPYSMIVSNPPYIQKEVCKTLDEDVKKEPMLALDGGEDGLDFYRAFLQHYQNRKIPFLFEIGYDEGESLINLAKEYHYDGEIIKDASQNPRVVYLVPNSH